MRRMSGGERSEVLRRADERAGFPSRLTFARGERWVVEGTPRLWARLLEGDLDAGAQTSWVLARTGRNVRDIPLPEAGDTITVNSKKNAATLQVLEVSGWPERRVTTFRMEAEILGVSTQGNMPRPVATQAVFNAVFNGTGDAFLD
jgi:hypothetical protein